MKKYFALLVCLHSISCTGYTTDQMELPDMSKAYPQDKFVNHSSALFESYNYATNRSFPDLKKQFKAFLGKNWIEVIKDDNKTEIIEAFKSDNTIYTGQSSYTNTAFQEMIIRLDQIKEQFSGQKFRVSINIIRTAGMIKGLPSSAN